MAVLAASLFTVISSSQLAMRHKMALGVTVSFLSLVSDAAVYPDPITVSPDRPSLPSPVVLAYSRAPQPGVAAVCRLLITLHLVSVTSHTTGAPTAAYSVLPRRFLPECLALVSLVVIMSKLDKEREASASTPDIPIGESLVALCL